MKNHTPRNPGELRRQAEERLSERQRGQKSEVGDQRSEEETAQILHELRVHQIELEMQNEELRRAQTEIEVGRERYFDLYDLAPVGYCTLSEKGLILEANLTMATLLGAARSALVKQPISRFILKDDQDIYYLHRKKLFDTHSTGSTGSPQAGSHSTSSVQAGQAGKPQECELRLTKPDGTSFWAHLTGTAAQTKDGVPVCRVALSDITERKKADEEIQKQLTEKETLLREVHHRVKNNIANIADFLTLQNDLTDNPEAKSAIKIAISRIQSMRIFYDKLLLSKDLREISMKNYIEDLVESFQNVFIGKDNIIIEKHISEFSISSKRAITIGIIINELLTNVFKYAFKDIDKGTASISIDKKENTVTIIIRDNGIGIDERIMENKSPGFGLSIVKMLVEQLKGTYSIVNENGTKSVIQLEI